MARHDISVGLIFGIIVCVENNYTEVITKPKTKIGSMLKESRKALSMPARVSENLFRKRNMCSALGIRAGQTKLSMLVTGKEIHGILPGIA